MPTNQPPSYWSPPNSQDISTSFAITLMEHLVVPTFVLDAERRVLIWNQACARLTAVPAYEVIGTRDHWRAFYDTPRPCLADLVATSDKALIDKLYSVHDNPEEPVFGIHAENWCTMPRLGSRLYLAVDAGPVYDEQGRLMAVVETLRDMTDKKTAEGMLQRLATQDFLTGLANRLAFDEALHVEWQRGEQQHSALSLIMFDADQFKLFNDTYGHLQGDACLRSISDVIKSNTRREGNTAARYGGEEFALLLPNTSQEEALGIAERIRAMVQGLGIPHAGNQETACVTVSAGCATLTPSKACAAEELVRIADAALYQAKHLGRNKTVLGQVSAAIPSRSGHP